MKTITRRLLLVVLLAWLVISPLWAVNPPGGTCTSQCDECGSCGSDGTGTGKTQSPGLGSFDWLIQVGLARYPKPTGFTDMANAANEKDGNLPDFRQIFSRYFPSSPLQGSQIPLRISQTRFSADTFNPACLYLQSEAVFTTLKRTDPTGGEYLHQILTDDAFTFIEKLAPVAPAAGSGFRVRVWKRHASPLIMELSGYYKTSDFDMLTPLTDATFKRGAADDSTLLYVQKKLQGVGPQEVLTNQIVQTLDTSARPDTVTSTLYQGEGAVAGLTKLREEVAVYTYPAATGRPWDYTMVRTVQVAPVDATGTIGTPLILTAKTQEVYRDFSPPASPGGDAGMKRLLTSTAAFGSAPQVAQTTTYTYVDSPANPLVHGRLLSTVFPNGSWNYFGYSNASTNPAPLMTEYSSWKDLTMDEPAKARKVVTTVEATSSVTETFVAGTLVAKTKVTLNVGASETLVTSERWDDTIPHVDTTAYHPDTAAAPNTGRIKWVERSDGTASIYSYAIAGETLTMTVASGAGSRSGITAGTTVITIYGLGNIPTGETTTDIASGLPTQSWATDTDYTGGGSGGYDPIGRPLKPIFNGDSNDYDLTNYDCCGGQPVYRARDGSTTTQYRDALKRVWKVETKADDTAPVVATTTAISGLTTTQSRAIGGQSLFLGASTGSLDGLTQTSTAPANKSILPADRPVTSSVTTHSAGTGDTTTTTDALGGTSITASYLDGQVKSRSGTAVADMVYDYAPYAGGLVTHTDTVTSTAPAASLRTSEYRDQLGRIFQIVSPATGTTLYAYHPLTASAGARGKLASVTDADNVAVSYGYNAKGEQTSTTRIIPLAAGSATHVTTIANDVLNTAAIVTFRGTNLGTCFRTTQSVTSTPTAGGATTVTLSVTCTARNGLASGTRSFGRETLTVTTRPDASGVATRKAVATDGTSTVATSTHGLTTSVFEKDSASATIRSTSYTYDTLQRPLTVVDSRSGTNTYGATGATTANVGESGLPLSITNSRGDTTGTAYGTLGRPVQTTLPPAVVGVARTSTSTAYYPTGQIKATWGSQTYPVWLEYDEAGRRTKLRTWKAAPPLPAATLPTGSTATTWNYSPATGLLETKTDDAGMGASYDYTTAGRLLHRKWARLLPTTTTPVTTTYTYTNGLLTGAAYNDATPAVTRAYDALGRVSTITQFHQSKIAYTYDPADLALGTETVSSDLDHNGTDEFTRTLDRSHDTLGRNTGYDLKNGAAVEFSAIATYHPLSGRPFTVANGTQSFTYGYQPSSHLIATVVGPVHVATSNWEDHRDVLASKINALATGGTVRSSIYYTVNSLGQRTDATRGGPAPGTTHWDYDGLGQVVLANDSNHAADRVFQYDTISNRKKSAVGTTLPGTDNYATNAVNQYTAIPSAPAAPLYDNDGNATTYPITPAGGFTQSASLVWDAENRLISTTPVGGGTTSYQYDALGRRIAKITAGTPTVFLYDGWNLIAEYTGASLTLRASFLWGTDLSGSAQGAGGVGGLLAARLHKGSTGVYYPLSDGNGNITDYLNSTGGVAAHYEYGPFGEPLVATGTVATQMPFRFSTKYQDAETGLLYYGYRYYDPITGRWLSRDPIGEEGGLNLCGFLDNKPIAAVDPLGQFSWKDLAFQSVGYDKAGNIPPGNAGIPIGLGGGRLQVTWFFTGSYFGCCNAKSGKREHWFSGTFGVEAYVIWGYSGETPGWSGPGRDRNKRGPDGKKNKDRGPENRPPEGFRERAWHVDFSGDSACPESKWTGSLYIFVRGSAGAGFIGGNFNLQRTWTFGDDSTGSDLSFTASGATGIFGASVEVGGGGSITGKAPVPFVN